MQRKKLTIVNFAERFRELVDSSGLSQKDLASALGISEGSIVNYKRDRIPKAEELLAISSYFGLTVEQLLTGTSQSQSQSMGDSGWKERAVSAEQKLAALRAGLEALAKKI